MIHLCLSCSASLDCEGFSGYCSACCHRRVDEYDDLKSERDLLAGQVKTLRATVYDALLTAKADWESVARHPASRHATDVRFYEAALSAPEPEKETRRHRLPTWAHDGDWHCERCNKVFASREEVMRDSSNCPGPVSEPEKEKTDE